MAVREFNGSTDYLRTSIGTLGSMTFGTYAAIFKLDDTAVPRTLICLLNSSQAFLTTPFQWIGTDQLNWDGPTASSFGTPAMAGNWVLAVVRKATGTTTPRLSWRNMNSGVWTHTAGGSTVANNTAPTSGFVNTSTSGGNSETFDGRIAVTAAWANTLPWSADGTGDAAIVSAGLEISLANWVTAAPNALWRWDPLVATGLVDSIGSANEVDRGGTTQITGDDPPGFSFDAVTYDLQAGPAVNVTRSSNRFS